MNLKAKLTTRQMEIAELLAFGKSKKGVAEKLFISIDTVDSHLRNIFYLTDTKKVGALAAWYFITTYSIDLSDKHKALIAKTIASIMLIMSLSQALPEDSARRASQRGRGRKNDTEYIFQTTHAKTA